MSFLIDTNVISEVRKGPRCDANVAHWFASIDDGELFLSVVVLGEIRKGIELARRRDLTKAEALQNWLGSVVEAFGDRIIPVDHIVSDEWGRMSAIRPIPVIDALLAATARIHGLTLVTRNDADVVGLSVPTLNPFTGRRS